MILSMSLEVDVPVDELTNDLKALANRALDIGAQFIVEKNRSVIANWDHQVDFNIESSSEGMTLIRTITCDDLIWQWVSIGTVPTEIGMPRSSLRGGFGAGGGAMAFPYQGVGNSYSAKTDGGSGARMGPVQWFSHINNRAIRARNLPVKAMEGRYEYLWALMQGAIDHV